MSILKKIFSLFGQNGNDENADETDFPYPLRSYPGEKALRVVLDQNEADSRLALLGDLSDGILLTGIEEINLAPRQIIDASKEFTGKEFLERTLAANPDLFGDVEAGEWPDNAGKEIRPHIMAHTDILTGRPKKKVYVAKIPTPLAHEIPAYLKLGGWNECPNPKELVSVFRYWEEKYSARIVSAAGDIIECVVENPPRSREEAMALAREQYIFCPDIVLQGVQTISNLAALLLEGKIWYFWWD